MVCSVLVAASFFLVLLHPPSPNTPIAAVHSGTLAQLAANASRHPLLPAILPSKHLCLLAVQGQHLQETDAQNESMLQMADAVLDALQKGLADQRVATQSSDS
jgi:hypothetical protein